MESITTSVLVLKNGDQVICNLKELYEGEEDNKRAICLLMIHPYTLSLVPVEGQDNLQVKFSKWCPYSIDTQFKLPYDSVITIGQSEPQLEIAYLNKLQEIGAINNEEILDSELEEVVTNE